MPMLTIAIHCSEKRRVNITHSHNGNKKPEYHHLITSCVVLYERILHTIAWRAHTRSIIPIVIVWPEEEFHHDRHWPSAGPNRGRHLLCIRRTIGHFIVIRAAWKKEPDNKTHTKRPDNK